MTGLDDTLERANAYREAGADVLFVEAPRTAEEMRTVLRSVPGVHLANMVAGLEYWVMAVAAAVGRLREGGMAMPTYEFLCTKCQKEFTVRKS